MLFVGGIPRRTESAAPVNPLWSGHDDTTSIQTRVAAQLGVSVFTIAEGNYILLKKGITLRGLGQGVTVLQSTDSAQFNRPNTGSSPLLMVINVCDNGDYSFHNWSMWENLAIYETARGPPV